MTRWGAKTWGAALLAGSLTLAACERGPASAPEPEPIAAPSEEAPVSIIRPDIEVAPEEPALADLEAAIPFGDGGSDLSDAALAELETILQSPQIDAGGKIVLRGHTDSVGSDDANLRASQQRADAVRDYLVEHGVEEDRIRTVALGEMRPIAPNATLEGEPDEAGRAANRRVVVFIDVPGEEPLPTASAEEETLVETMTADE